MLMKTYNRFVVSVIAEKRMMSMAEVGRARGGGVKSLKRFNPRPVVEPNAYTREISIGGYRHAG